MRTAQRARGSLKGKRPTSCDTIALMNIARCLCVLALLSACGDDPFAADTGPETTDVPVVDAGDARDAGALPDAAIRDAALRDAALRDAALPDGGLPDVPSDAGPPIDGGGACCVPIDVADQEACRVIEALGEGACGSVGGGGVCVWSAEAACASEEPGCCTAAMAGSEGFCAALDDISCQATRQCSWSPAACSDACCQATRAGFEGMCEGLSGNQTRCESLRDCAWSDVPECTMMEPSCCTASRAGFEGLCADLDSSMAMCQSVRDCVWSGAAECSPAMDEGCCVASRMGFERFCMAFENRSNCSSVRDCAWEDDLLRCR